MRTPRNSGGHRLISDFLAEDDDSSGDEQFSGAAMLPVFLDDQSEVVEVMLELDEESMAVRNVTPTAGLVPDRGRSLSRSSSSASMKIRRKFGWLRSSSSPSTTPRPSEENLPSLAARDARRIRARLDRTRSGARRALNGLRFINRATGSVEAEQLWRPVDQRFDSLAKDGLLSREDFGDCIGLKTKLISNFCFL